MLRGIAYSILTLLALKASSFFPLLNVQKWRKAQKLVVKTSSVNLAVLYFFISDQFLNLSTSVVSILKGGY